MKNIKGFTLIESLVAIAILTLAVSGAFFTANRAIVAAGIARDQLTASFLAQEGIEYVRLLRDNAYLAAPATAWSGFLTVINSYSCLEPNICTLAPRANPVQCPSGVCTATFILGSNGTSFMRTIKATTISASDEKIVSEVSWSYHNSPYTVTITDHLTPWQ